MPEPVSPPNGTGSTVVDLTDRLRKGPPPPGEVRPEGELTALQSTELYREEDSPLLDVTQGARRVALRLGLLLAVALVAGGSLIPLDWTVELPVELVRVEGEHRYSLFEDVVIDARHVVIGDRVDLGQPLLRLRSAELSEALARLHAARAELAWLEAESTEQQARRRRLGFELARAEALLRERYGPHAAVSEGDAHLDVTAATAGRVAHLSFGSRAPAGTLLHALVSDSAEGQSTAVFHATATIAPRQVGLLQRVLGEGRLRLDADSLLDQGSLSATLVAVSSVDDETGHYRAHLSLGPVPASLELTTGMTGTVSLVVERRSLLGQVTRGLIGSTSS
ncbi:MAG: hypothetical protein AAF533_01820 [Acidobacteriota bacterium]